jgi:uncharacterized protein (UPF0332 family)
LISHEYFAKAERALAAAHRALRDNDSETAANRTYYAMYDVARAALLHVGQDKAAAGTHATVIGQFGLHLCVSGPIPSELGTALNQAQELRNEGDYLPTAPELAVVRKYVGLADRLIAAVRDLLSSTPPSEPST